jgi:hypothetical protein
MRFGTLEDATHTLARLLFNPPTLPEAVRRIDTIEAAKAFQISVSAVMHCTDSASTGPRSCDDMYGFWMDGGWQHRDWEDDENDWLCPVAFLVGILFDREWIQRNFECDGGDHSEVGLAVPWIPTPSQSLALENPWEMIDSILKSEKIQCDVACLGLTFVYTWWHERGGGTKKNGPSTLKSARGSVFGNMLGTS